MSTAAFSLPCLDEVLSVKADPTPYEAKSLIYTAGSHGIYFVHEGIVRTFHDLQDGGRVHGDFYVKGMFFGLSCFEQRSRHDESAAAYSDCVLSEWRVPDLAVLLTERPAVGRALLGAVVEQSIRQQNRLLRAERFKSADRLREALVDLADRIGVREGPACWIKPGITHQVLAEMIGSKREIVTGHLNAMRRAGLLSFSRRHLVIYDALRGQVEARKAAA